MNIEVNTNAALDDAKEIDQIVNDMTADMEELNGKMDKLIPNEIQTNWSETVKSNWKSYYSSDIPETMEDMKLSASNLRQAVENALQYSNDN